MGVHALFRLSKPLRIPFALLAGICGFLLTGCEKEPIRFGLAGVLTGPYADLGIHARNGARLAIEEINRRGGVGGRHLMLLVQNDEGTLEGAKRARETLIRQGASVIIGHMLSTQCMDALLTSNEVPIPLVSPVASSPLLSGKKDNFFRLRPDTGSPARLLARHLVSRGLNRAGVFFDVKNPSYTEPWVGDFARALEALGGEIVFTEGFDQLEAGSDLSLARSVLQKSPDALLLVASAEETARLLVTLHRVGVQAPVFGVGWAQTDRLIAQAGQAAEAIVLATNDPPLEEKTTAQDFVRSYQRRFGVSPAFAAARSYDTVRFLVQALESVGGRPEKLREALAQPKEFDGVFGRMIMDSFGDVHAESYLVTVRDSRFILVNPGETL
ncbi:MAG: ABC transporter substrate-binding protein [Desulfosoma sp.]